MAKRILYKDNVADWIEAGKPPMSKGWCLALGRALALSSGRPAKAGAKAMKKALKKQAKRGRRLPEPSRFPAAVAGRSARSGGGDIAGARPW